VLAKSRISMEKYLIFVMIDSQRPKRSYNSIAELWRKSHI
jgi:hypothetical protein